MTVGLLVTCDGHRHGERCRAFLPTRTRVLQLAVGQAEAAGWVLTEIDSRLVMFCHSGGHDEDAAR